MRQIMRSLVVIAALLMLAVCGLQAQTFRGGIQGTVSDSTGAAIPGAQVTVINPATGLTRPAVTDDEGNYFVNELPLGSYSVTVTKAGFRTQTATGVQISVATPQRLDIKLAPGQVSEKVEVTAQVPLVEVTNNNQGGVVEAEKVEALPVNGRDWLKVLTLVPGAAADASGETDSPGSFGYLSVNGNRGRSNNYLLDGTDMNDGYRNDPIINEGGVFGTPATILPIDALAEIPIINGGEAEYGRNSGAIINIVTKSGTNKWHGSAFEYLRNQNLDARNYFNRVGTAQNSFNNNQFGGSLGGPLWKDHTFFFVSYEGQREHGSTPASATVPTQGDIQEHIATGGTINPVIANLLALNPWHIPQNLLTTSPSGFPLPAGGPGGLTFETSDPFNNRVDSLIVKIDQHLRGNKDLLTGRYFYGNSDQSFPLGLVGGSATTGYNTLTPTTVHVLSLSYTWVQSPKLLIEFRGGFNSFFETFLPQDKTFNPATIGLNTGVTNPNDFGLPQFRFTCISTSGTGASCPTESNIGATPGINRGRTDRNAQFFTNFTYTTGKHNFKWGYEYRRTWVDQFFDAGYRGVLNFVGNDQLGASPFDSFLSGSPGFSNHQLRGDSQRDTFQNNNSLYFQDNWRILPRFTLNLGLRWDYDGVIGEDHDRFSIFDPATQAPKRVGSLYPNDLNNFAPRISFAWDVLGTGKTVLRSGWGVFYDAFSQDFFAGQLPFPTYNAGPAFNFISASDPFSINLSYSPSANLGVVPSGGAPCPAGTIAVPGSASCSGPTFLFSPTFGNDIFTVDQHIRTPYVQNFNLNLQQQIGNNLSFEIGYVGSQGRKLFQFVDINQCNAALALVTPSCHPYPNAPGFGYVLQFQSSASSNFNSLQTSLNIRSWHGLTSTFNYVYSHSIDTASDGQDYVPNASQPDDSVHPGRERASSNFDQRHRFSWTYDYSFPNMERWKVLTNGWSMSGSLSLTAGMPYNVSFIDNFQQDFNGTGEFYGRPDIVGNPYAGTGGLNILNLDALAVPCTYDPASGGCTGNQHIGDLGRNAFVGPTYKNFDFGVGKTFKLSERFNLLFRTDFFNLFNHPNFTNPLLPNFEVDMTQNGVNPANGHGIGFLQPTATPDVAIGDPYLGGGGARNIQFGLKLTF